MRYESIYGFNRPEGEGWYCVSLGGFNELPEWRRVKAVPGRSAVETAFPQAPTRCGDQSSDPVRLQAL
jgi:hypothetical protein